MGRACARAHGPVPSRRPASPPVPPQQSISLDSRTAQVNSAPRSRSGNGPPRKPFAPQQSISPDSRTAQVWLGPTLTDRKLPNAAYSDRRGPPPSRPPRRLPHGARARSHGAVFPRAVRLADAAPPQQTTSPTLAARRVMVARAHLNRQGPALYHRRGGKQPHVSAVAAQDGNQHNRRHSHDDRPRYPGSHPCEWTPQRGQRQATPALGPRSPSPRGARRRARAGPQDRASRACWRCGT